jgi:hypothetical protein
MARWGHNSTIATSPAPPLRFRTSGFPQYGSKSRRGHRQPDPARKIAEVKRRVRIPSVAARFGLAFVAREPSCGIRWRYQPARLRPRQRPPRPTGPSLRRGSSVPSLYATAARSARLGRTPGFPTVSGYTGGPARRRGLGCHRVLPCFGSALRPRVPSPLRREERQGPHPHSAPAPRAFLRT